MSPRRLLTRYQIGNPRLLLSLILWPVFWGPVAASPPVTITVFNEVANPIDARLFGQFLERAGKSEPGPEGAVATGRRTLRPDVVRTLAGWKIPVVRFPGGTAVELGGPWTNLIDNAPDRATPARPADCRFGFHEFFRLCKDIQAEPLIVVKLTGGIFPWQANTRGSVLRMAMAEVAYMNAPLDAKLPDELARWPRLRAKNGHPAPFHVKYWQIGNEPLWGFANILADRGKTPDEILSLYIDYVDEFATAMRRVDPGICLLAEEQMEAAKPPIQALKPFYSRLRDKVNIFTFHVYQPWEIKTVLKNGEPYPLERFTEKDLWYAVTAVPGADPATGESRVVEPVFAKMKAARMPVGITEWNLNIWWAAHHKKGINPPYSDFANGVGAAGFLHAFMRDGDTIRLATQSMLVGSKWGIAGVRVDPNNPKYLKILPSALFTGLYSRYHGNERMKTTIADLPVYSQPFTLSNIKPAKKMALVDVVVTRTKNTLYLHAINRDYSNDQQLVFDLRRLGAKVKKITRISVSGQSIASCSQSPVCPAKMTSASVPLKRVCKSGGATLSLTIPAKSVSIYVVKLTPGLRERSGSG